MSYHLFKAIRDTAIEEGRKLAIILSAISPHYYSNHRTAVSSTCIIIAPEDCDVFNEYILVRSSLVNPFDLNENSFHSMYIPYGSIVSAATCSKIDQTFTA